MRKLLQILQYYKANQIKLDYILKDLIQITCNIPSVPELPKLCLFYNIGENVFFEESLKETSYEEKEICRTLIGYHELLLGHISNTDWNFDAYKERLYDQIMGEN